MLATLLLLLVLSGTWFVVRAGTGRQAPPRERERDAFEVWMGALMLAVAAFPLLALAPWVQGPAETFWGDSSSHARVANEIASKGLPHGWLDSYVGGFPFGHHYPPLAWLLIAGTIRLGLSPAEATHLVGWSATLATPFCIYFLSIRVGARPRFAFIGATLLMWVSPYNSFVGGYETFFGTGLVSQSVGLPIAVWLAGSALRGSKRWEAPVAAVLAMASHPQVATATLTVLAIGVLASGNVAAILGCMRAGLFSLIAGAALYGQGIATLEIPLGWPPGLGWRQFGFVPSRVGYWLFDAALLDQGRPPVFTALTLAALAGLLLNFKRPMARGLGIAFIASIALSVSGRLLFELGATGRALLSFLQPLRLSALLPPLAALLVVALLGFAAKALEAAFSNLDRPSWSARVSPALLVATLGIALFALPSRFDYSQALSAKLRTTPTSCGPRYSVPEGYQRGRVESWLAALSGGKLWYDTYHGVPAKDCLVCCINLHGLDVESAVAIASVGGVGGHVGTLTHAGKFLQPERQGFTRRAEALGVRYLLVTGNANAPPGWMLRERSGRVVLLERTEGTHRVGLGCIRKRYSGSEAALRTRLHSEFETAGGADALLNPTEFVELVPGQGAVRSSNVPAGGCDAEGAELRLIREEPGLVEASVTSAAPVDVVFRATAFRGWKVFDRGKELAPIRKVAPGFFSVRVSRGRHELRATVSPMPGYGWLVASALLVIAALSFVRERELLSLMKRRGRANVKSPPR